MINRIPLGLLVFGLSIGLIFCFSIHASGQNPEISASFDNAIRLANVEPGNPTNGLTLNTGVISCDSGNKTQVTVNLTVQAGNWTASVSPTSMTFPAGSSDKPFELTVNAPIGTFSSVTREVWIDGTWKANDNTTGRVSNSSFILEVDQYFDLTFSAEAQESVEGGKKVKIEFEISNTGNGLDDFPFQVTNHPELRDDGWIIPTVPKFTIKRGRTRYYEVNFTAPSKSRTYDIGLRVFSEESWRINSTDPKEVIVTLTVRVKEDSDDGTPFLSTVEIIGLVSVVTISIGRRRKFRGNIYSNRG